MSLTRERIQQPSNKQLIRAHQLASTPLQIYADWREINSSFYMWNIQYMWQTGNKTEEEEIE